LAESKIQLDGAHCSQVIRGARLNLLLFELSKHH
jgi:hypothetical protein